MPPADLLLSAIVNSSDDAIVSKNLDSIITSWNLGAERIFGYTAEEAIGHSVLMLVPEDRHDEEPRILKRLRNGERVDHFETVRVRKNREHFPVSLTISPIRDLQGKIVGASKIARDITDLKRTAAEREQLLESERVARAQAERANQMKDEFLSTISHELRTPLNAMIGWTQVLKESGGLSPDALQGIEVIERNAFAQAQLIDDLLDLGRVSSGKLLLQVEWVELGPLIEEVLTSVRQTAGASEIGIRAIFDRAGGIMGDKSRLRQVLLNLLSNSIKFTPPKGRIVVTVTRVNSHVELAVTDNGRGIEPSFLPHVFERFRQADASSTRHYGGLGIGLALVKQIVELHGGTVRAESEGLGHGATFTVALPIVAARAVSPARGETPAGRSEAVSVTDNLAGINVLAIDDDRDSLEVVKRILSARRAEVRTATSAAGALEIVGTFFPDVILSDIGMPGQDGYELIRRLRQLPGMAAVPAVALTALVRAEDRMRALRAGFQTHVGKPVTPSELVAVVRSLASLQSSAGTQTTSEN